MLWKCYECQVCWVCIVYSFTVRKCPFFLFSLLALHLESLIWPSVKGGIDSTDRFSEAHALTCLLPKHLGLTLLAKQQTLPKLPFWRTTLNWRFTSSQRAAWSLWTTELIECESLLIPTTKWVKYRQLVKAPSTDFCCLCNPGLFSHLVFVSFHKCLQHRRSWALVYQSFLAQLYELLPTAFYCRLK